MGRILGQGIRNGKSKSKVTVSMMDHFFIITFNVFQASVDLTHQNCFIGLISDLFGSINGIGELKNIYIYILGVCRDPRYT